jgi:hypothetical protein
MTAILYESNIPLGGLCAVGDMYRMRLVTRCEAESRRSPEQ